MYLKQSLKDSAAKSVIEGLSKSGEHYEEAIKSLKACYDRPRLIHQTHVRMILEAASLKEGTGKELRRLHDTVQQHLQALKAMDYEPSGPFITSVLELKLDTTTMFEWQKLSQEYPKVPHYQDLLEFLYLQAQASESLLTSAKRGVAFDKHKTSPRPITSFAASASANFECTCIPCKSEKHPLFACHQFKTMPHDKKISTLKANDLCMNCLHPGHFVKQCKSVHRCKRCHGSHHTLLHVDQKEQNTPPTASLQAPVINHSASVTTPGLSSHSLLKTCRVLVHAPYRSSVVSRVLLDPGSLASFVSERLVQTKVRIMGIGGHSQESPTLTLSKFVITSVQEQRMEIDVTAIIMPRVTCDLPLQPILFKPEWTHLSDLSLADPNFGQPGRIDILLGVDIFTQILR